MHARFHFHLLLDVLVADASLDSGPGGDAVDPLQQVREGLHVLSGKAAALPALDPRPGLDVGHRVLALAGTGEVVARALGRVLAGQADLEHAVDAQGFVLVAVDGVCKREKRVRMENKRIREGISIEMENKAYKESSPEPRG